jgi:hypothetical protein
MGVLHCFHQNAGTFKKSFFSLFSSSAHSNTPSTAMRDYKNLVRDTRMRLSVVRFKPRTRSGKPQYPLTKRRLNYEWRKGDPTEWTSKETDSMWAKWVVKQTGSKFFYQLTERRHWKSTLGYVEGIVRATNSQRDPEVSFVQLLRIPVLLGYSYSENNASYPFPIQHRQRKGNSLCCRVWFS